MVFAKTGRFDLACHLCGRVGGYVSEHTCYYCVVLQQPRRIQEILNFGLGTMYYSVAYKVEYEISSACFSLEMVELSSTMDS
jgi:hypothetical protein